MIFSEYVKNELLPLAKHNKNESITTKYVIRNNKRVKKKVSDKDNYKVVYQDGVPTEKRIQNEEKKNRRLGQKLGKGKRSAKDSIIQMRRKRSFMQRKKLNMDYQYNDEL